MSCTAHSLASHRHLVRSSPPVDLFLLPKRDVSFLLTYREVNSTILCAQGRSKAVMHSRLLGKNSRARVKPGISHAVNPLAFPRRNIFCHGSFLKTSRCSKLFTDVLLRKAVKSKLHARCTCNRLSDELPHDEGGGSRVSLTPSLSRLNPSIPTSTAASKALLFAHA